MDTILHLVWARDRKAGKLPQHWLVLENEVDLVRLTLATTGEGGKRTERNKGDSGESVAPKPDLPARP